MTNIQDFNQFTFDYIIVGTGPAGSVIAHKLSESGSNSVLVLEAGDNHDQDPAVQSSHGGTFTKVPEYFWPEPMQIRSEIDSGGTITVGGGRLAGGGSSVNGEVYVRPSNFVLEKWAAAAGSQWLPENATQNFRELEKFNGEHVDPAQHGQNGQLDIRQVYQNPPALLQKINFAIEKATGLPTIDDYNDPRTPLGPFLRMQLYQKPDGSRASASVEFLDEQKMMISYQTTVTKVVFNEMKEATGVEFICRGQSGEVHARKKVIVCAGIRSSQLLMLSGIGDRAALEKLGIKVIVDNPQVGKNLMNDAAAPAFFTVNKNETAAVSEADDQTMWQSGAFLPPAGENRIKARSVELLTMLRGETLMMSVIMVDPQSRGELILQSDDPLKVLLIKENFLTNEADLTALVKIWQTYIKKIAATLAEIDPAYQLISPAPEILDDEVKLKAYLRQNFQQTYHEQGALKMGSPEAGAVVDGFGRVYGTENLIVADTSIIPYHMDGNTSAAAYLIGYTIAKNLLH